MIYTTPERAKGMLPTEWVREIYEHDIGDLQLDPGPGIVYHPDFRYQLSFEGASLWINRWCRTNNPQCTWTWMSEIKLTFCKKFVVYDLRGGPRWILYPNRVVTAADTVHHLVVAMLNAGTFTPPVFRGDFAEISYCGRISEIKYIPPWEIKETYDLHGIPYVVNNGVITFLEIPNLDLGAVSQG